MIVVFDGACALCSYLVRWATARMRAPDEVCWLPSQSCEGQTLLRRLDIVGDPDTLVVVFRDHHATRSAAIVALLHAMRSPFPRIGKILEWLPAVLRDAGYRIVSAVRRCFGSRSDRCRVLASATISMELPDVDNIPWIQS